MCRLHYVLPKVQRLKSRVILDNFFNKSRVWFVFWCLSFSSRMLWIYFILCVLHSRIIKQYSIMYITSFPLVFKPLFNSLFSSIWFRTLSYTYYVFMVYTKSWWTMCLTLSLVSDTCSFSSACHCLSFGLKSFPKFSGVFCCCKPRSNKRNFVYKRITRS